MRTNVIGVTVASVLLVVGAATAQTAGPSLSPASRDVIPVTGPSIVPSLPEPAKSDVIPVAAGGTVANGEVGDARKRPADRAPAAAATPPAPRAAKAVHRPAAKPAVKRASAPKQVVKGPRPATRRHVAAAKRHPPAHHVSVRKPIPVTKHPPAAKNATPLLPRV